MARILCNVAGGGKPLKGNAGPGDVLAGKTFSNKQSNALTGSMPNNGTNKNAVSVGGGSGSLWAYMPYGYYDNYKNSGNAWINITNDQAKTLATNAGVGYNRGVSDADGRVNTSSASYNSGYANGHSTGYNEGKAASRVEVSAYGNIYGQSGDEHAGVTVHLVVKVGGVVVYNNSASRFGNHGPSTDTLTYSN